MADEQILWGLGADTSGLLDALNALMERLQNINTELSRMADMASLLDPLAQTMSTMSASDAGLSDQIGATAEALQGLADAAAKAGESVAATADAEKTAADESGGLGEMMGGLGESFMGAFEHAHEFMLGMLEFQALSGVTQGISEFAGNLIGMNAKFEQLRATLTAITGSSGSAGKIMDWVQQFGTKVPDTTEHLAEATVQIESLGLNAEDIMPSIANVAAVMGTDLPTAARAFSDAYEGRFMMMQNDLHISKKQLEDFGLVVSKTGKVDVNSLMDAFKKLSDTKFKGGLETQMGTLNGQLSNLTDRVQFFAMRMGKPIFDAAKEGLGAIFNFLDAHQAQINGFADIVGNALPAAFKAVGRAAQTIIGDVEKVFSFFETHKAAVMVLAGALGILGIALLAFAVTFIPPLIVGLWGLVAAGVAAAGTFIVMAAPFLLVGAGILALGLLIKGAYDKFEPLRQVVANVIKILQGLWQEVIQNVKPVWTDLMSQINTVVIPVWNQLVAAFNQMKPVLLLLGAIFAGTIVVAIGLVVGVFRGLLSAIQPVMNGIFTIVGGIIMAFTGIVQTISAIFTGIYNVINDIIHGQWGKIIPDILNMFGGMKDGVGNILHGLWSIIAGFFGGLFGGIAHLLGGFVMGVIGFFQHLFDKLVGHSIVPDMILGIIEFFATLPLKVLEIIGGFVLGLLFKFAELEARGIMFILSLVSKFIHAIENLVNRVLGFFFQLETWVLKHIFGLSDGTIKKIVDMQRSFVQHFEKLVNDVIALVTNFVKSVLAFIMQLKDDAMGFVKNMVDGFTNIIHGLLTDPIDTVKKLVQSIGDEIGKLPGQALQWGKDMIQKFIDGIKNMAGNVKNAIGSIAKDITNLLGFSTPVEGPLAQSDKWMPDFGDLLARGMEEQADKMKGPAGRIAAAIGGALPSVNGTAVNVAGNVAGSPGDGGAHVQILQQILEVLKQGQKQNTGAAPVGGIPVGTSIGSLVQNFNQAQFSDPARDSLIFYQVATALAGVANEYGSRGATAGLGI